MKHPPKHIKFECSEKFTASQASHPLSVSVSVYPFSSSDLLTVLPRHFVKVTGMAHELVLRDLPFEVPPVHVDSQWHRRQGQRSDHAWLRLAVGAAAQKAFAAA